MNSCVLRTDIFKGVIVDPVLNVAERIAAQYIHVVGPNQFIAEFLVLNGSLTVTFRPEKIPNFSEKESPSHPLAQLQ